MKNRVALVVLIFSLNSFAQCTYTNHTFKTGEKLVYKIYYNWGVLWVPAGEASCEAEFKTINNRQFYHFTALGATYPKYDWFYKVRDKYESYADTFTLKPLRFMREVQEGKNQIYQDYVFNQRKGKLYSSSRAYGQPARLDSLKITACTNDLVTAIYYARCLDYSKYKPKDSIPITFVLDGEVCPSYIRYMGKEIINDATLGKVRCIKFRPKLIAGTIFKGGEGMTVWITDDENKIPVYVETPIVIGSVKAYLVGYSNLRNKMDCLVDKKK